MSSDDVVAERLHDIYERIALAGADPTRVRVVAVTKGFGVDAVVAAARAGLDDIGENYAQEARAKFDAFERLEQSNGSSEKVRWHFIGHLQRNKVRMLAPFVDVWQSVDSIALASEIQNRAPGATAFIEVNLAGEEQRSGCAWGEVAQIVDHARTIGLDVQGLMGVAPIGDPESARPSFRRLAETAQNLEIAEVSMGMSADLEVAVQEGATIVRIGSGLFGERQPRVRQ